MKKLPLSFLYWCLSLFFCKPLFAQSLVPHWAAPVYSSSGYLSSGDVGVATDKQGNSYILVSSGSGYLDADGHLSTDPTATTALISFDCDRNFRWMKTFGGAQSDFYGEHLATDSMGGVYVSGRIINGTAAGTASWGSDTAISVPAAGYVCYIVKYDTLGQFRWLRTPAAYTNVSLSNPPQPAGLSVSPSGDVFWFSLLNPGSYSGGFSVASRGNYVVAYNAAGSYQNLTMLDFTPSPNYIGGYNGTFIHYDPVTDRFYVCLGYSIFTYGSSLSMGATAILSGDSTITAVLGAFNRQGANLWVRQGDTAHGSTPLREVETGKDGTIYLLGMGDTGSVFCGDTLTNPLWNGASYVMAIDSNGDHLWATHEMRSGYGASYLQEVNVANNTLVVNGYYSGPASWGSYSFYNPPGQQRGLMMQLNAATGAVLYLDTMKSGQGFYTYHAAIDRNGNIYVAGWSQGVNLIFANDTLTGNAFGFTNADYAALMKYKNVPCHCDLLQPAFTATSANGTTYQFSYTGQTPYTSVSWDFGDGSAAASGPSVSHTYTAQGTFPVCVTATNSCGSNTVCHYMTIKNIAGVKNVSNFKDVVIYPNPAKEVLTISHLEKGMKVEVMDLLGRSLIKAVSNNEELHLPVEHFSAGVYVVRFTGDNGKQGSSLFVKE